MTDQHFYDRHHELFWSVTVYETFWVVVLASTVVGGLIMGLSALAH